MKTLSLKSGIGERVLPGSREGGTPQWICSLHLHLLLPFFFSVRGGTKYVTI